MFGRGGVLWLLAHELRISWRNWLAAGRQRGGRGRIVMYLVLALVLGVGGFWAADAVSGLEPAPTPLVLGAIGAVFAFLLTFMASQALMLITEALYQRGDLDLLLASPLPAWRVLIVRMAAVALNVATFYLAAVIAVFVWLPMFGGWQWMGFAPTILALALFATGLAIVLARLLFGVIGAKATRIGAQIIASIMGAAFFLAIQTQNYVPPGERAAAYRALLTRLVPVLGNPASPLSLPARAAIGQPGALAIWIGAAIGFYLIAVWWFARGYLANASAIAGIGAGRRRADLAHPGDPRGRHDLAGAQGVAAHSARPIAVVADPAANHLFRADVFRAHALKPRGAQSICDPKLCLSLRADIHNAGGQPGVAHGFRRGRARSHRLGPGHARSDRRHKGDRRRRAGAHAYGAASGLLEPAVGVGGAVGAAGGHVRDRLGLLDRHLVSASGQSQELPPSHPRGLLCQSRSGVHHLLLDRRHLVCRFRLAAHFHHPGAHCARAVAGAARKPPSRAGPKAWRLIAADGSPVCAGRV
jgi:hypothetical protein